MQHAPVYCTLISYTCLPKRLVLLLVLMYINSIGLSIQLNVVQILMEADVLAAFC